MDVIKDVAGSIAGDTVEKLILFMAGWLIEVFTTMLDLVGTWWLNIGAPEMGAGSATERVQTATTTFVGVAGIIGTAFAVLRIARDHNRESAENLVMGLIRTVVVSGLAVSMVALSLAVTDEVAPWLVDTIAGNAARDRLGQSMGLSGMVGAGMALPTAGILLFLTPFALLGAILNAALVIFSYGVAGALCGLLPIFAAASTTQKGQKSFDKAVGWLLAMILFKPGAAVIYGFGLALMNGIDGTGGDEVSNKIISLLTGTVVIFSACFAMPALVRVLVPAVSAGPRGMGAGGLAMVGGALAIGAVTAGVGTLAAGAAAGAGAAGAGAAGAGAGGAAGAAGGAAGAAGAGAGGAGAAGTGAAGAGAGGASGGAAGAGSSATGAGAGSGAGGGASSTTGAPGSAAAGAPSGGPVSAGGPAGGPAGAENVESTTAGAAATSAPGTTTGGTSGAENVQSSSTGAAPTSAAGTGTGGASGAEQVQSSSSSSAAAGGASEASGPAGAEPVAATNGAAPAGHPGGEGSSVTGAKNPLINGQRLEFGLREAVRDAEQSIESGEDL
ncbi:hypothetical protein [Kocuria rosea]|uniref:hypothetical protein n=1 Tax=Kocuria rosea TaxID=1275 RepID=UPI002540E2E3|nr:hypothetical protein [Kocuria rosea]WIG19191.1 hypothetical protein QOY29_17795 [Kocuria rosea]